MINKFEISYEQIKNINSKYYKALNFKNTGELDEYNDFIGQEKAKNAMEFGIAIKKRGYNIYIAGENGCNKKLYALKILEEASKDYNKLFDFCYVYNFENKLEPTSISLEAGQGIVFKKEMELFVDNLLKELTEVFESEDYEAKKNIISDELSKKKDEFINNISEQAQENNLKIKVSSSGITFIPYIDGKPMTEDEYDNIDEIEKEKITTQVAEIKNKASNMLRKFKITQKKYDEYINQLNLDIAKYIINKLIKEIRYKYSNNIKIIKYIDDVSNDILENINLFIDIDEDDIDDLNELLNKYRINLIVDNSDIKKAPVIYEQNPTYNNLIGNIEYVNKQGNLITDYTMIRAGSIMKANGGYLVVDAENILKNYKALEGLENVLIKNQIRPEGLRSQLDILTIESMKPQAIDIDLKVIVIGSENIYQLLYNYDDDFSNLFKVKVEFDYDIEKNNQNIYKIAQYVNYYCKSNKLRQLENSAIIPLIEYSSKISGSNKKMTACFKKICDIIDESDIYAQKEERALISKEDIVKAIEENIKRINLIEEKIFKQFEYEKIIISTDGYREGQVNGLSVIENSGYCFGKPFRITASSYIGKNGIINIEREVSMSGNIHNKSVMIITGFIGSLYAKYIPLSLTVNLCFEQLYGYIDGDSASIAELFAILSSISKIPLKQSIAVTGSMNQKGEVQPVGGINEKILGYYKLCNKNKLNGKQGVIIPYKNIDDLVLDENIIKDIKNGLFHIYAIKNIDEGIEILTGMKFGKNNENGEFEKNTFNFYVDKELKTYNKNIIYKENRD